ncbi:hypothetical protein P4159_05995 [Bacillus thuringiensis]|uniref:hypothetical protein n=1 Tax=Bacillus cereus group TaxID=86661 RepID=UPI000CD99FAE|nr:MULTISPECIES: hypothetical protein [Bacillus cereus group]MEC3420530.1 hypothetical protein [Bacillus cereus]MEC3596940.1 hypothetical protein [Bacillus thuringiensis]MED1574289.1 hypothetical protein [Bacillus paranthracis]MED1836213.1 hypothetical protein [Bacillus thuringiensis]MED2670276.1 hypothetical protein [Bacillus thuringiensis]
MRTEFKCVSYEHDVLSVEPEIDIDGDIEISINDKNVFLSVEDAKELVETLEALIQQGEQE